jgi:predicted lipoprotein with Yx(FWY)xxD motif
VNPFALSRPLLRIALAVLAALGLATAALLLPGSSPAATKSVAKQGTVTSLGKAVLTNNAGHTLYSLSAETKGRFICTGDCLGTWRPLVVAAGTKPSGPAKLATIKRPDGRTQVTFKGRPLYSFNGDSKPGEANGEGFKDVGTWHAAVLGSASSAPQSPGQEPAPSPSPTPPPNPYPSPY